jgi:hypothetical protein
MDSSKKDLRDVNDRLDSLHRRMDKFYEWTAILQKEFRDMQQRQKFLESKTDFVPDPLQARMNKIKLTSQDPSKNTPPTMSK